jgi:hypothetical protein
MSTYHYISVSADAKTIKGEKRGFLTGILYLAPANSSGINTCANASPGCIGACLNTAGRAGIFPAIQKARLSKTKELFADREKFIQRLVKDIRALERQATRQGLTPCVRVNGTSDLPWLAQRMAREFPHIRFYDYSKHPRIWEHTTLPNYHLTFSHSETNLAECLETLAHGANVAVVFDTKKGQPLPATWHGYPVHDGDISDLRFLDKFGVIGVRAKGKAKKDCTGFVQSSAELAQIQEAA